MKALIYILAIVLIAAGVAVGLVSLLSPGQVVLGLDLHLGGTLLAGGVVTLALAGVITTLGDVMRHLRRVASAGEGPAIGETASSTAGMEPAVARKPADAAGPADDDKPATGLAPEVVAGVAAVAVAATASSDDEASPEAEVVETTAVAARHEILMRPREEAADKSAAAEQPGEDDKAADAGDKAAKASVDEAAHDEDEEVAAPEEAAEEAGEQEPEVAGLYVVEERTIHGRPARLLSDGTVEAETDEGWMRFENLEHLEEYTAATEGA